MKIIYDNIVEQLKPLVNEELLRYVDWDKGQLKKEEKGRYPVAYPCALIRIGILSTEDYTDYIQTCKANVTVTLAFNPQTLFSTKLLIPKEQYGIEPYEVINEVYKSLQGFSTLEFNPLRRRSQSEVNHPHLFVYQLVFETQFQDESADQ